MMFEKILVPIDFSESSEAIVHFAGQLARRFGASLTLLHVVETIQLSDPRDMSVIPIEALAAKAEEALERLAPTRECATRVALGIPRDEIVQTAEKDDFDLIVMATHGRSGVARFFLGSVTESVLRASPCPVLCVRPGQLPKATAAEREEVETVRPGS
jgi:nucleotide-binding universal stress UspA family protein